MKQDYIAHIKQGKTERIIQTCQEHAQGVAELSGSFAGSFGLSSWGRALGLLHDKGKERDAFQYYIRKANDLHTDGKCKDQDHHHAFVGGILAQELIGAVSFHLLANPILSHHTGLHDEGDAKANIDRPLPPEIGTNIAIDKKQIMEELRAYCKQHQPLDIDFHHLSRMLFSCLVDADYLDTERFMNEAAWQMRNHSATPEMLLPKLEVHLETLRKRSDDSPVNQIRQQVQEQCSQKASGEKGFYSLTVPTGGGKTLASVLWALKHAAHHKMSRIIIAIPYTSIIVQTASILKQIFGEENVLEHHSNFDPENIKDEKLRDSAQLATENWNYPIIVTTNVQLFESLFSNKPSDCRKLHNIVNSVLILDEVQMLPTGFLQPIVDSLKAYQKMFDVSVLLTTASQPVLSGLIEGCNPKAKFEGIDHITEIIPSEMELHNHLRRVDIKVDEQGSSYDEIAEKIAQYDKVLCIVNTRKDAKEIYERLPDNGVKLHLSRMMCPAHVKETIEKIKTLLKDENTPVLRVVATQLVEAGVDIDFPVVFRQEAGLDSVLQAAGRCNREGKKDRGLAFVFSLSKENRLPRGSINAGNEARKSLSDGCDYFAPDTMNEYFKQLYCRLSNFDEKDMKYYLYHPQDLYFEEAAKKFRLIDGTGVNVIVNWRDSMDWVEELKKNGISYPLAKKMSQYSVALQKYDFEQLQKECIFEEVLEGFYVAIHESQYDDKVGLLTTNQWLEETLMV